MSEKCFVEHFMSMRIPENERHRRFTDYLTNNYVIDSEVPVSM